MKIIRAILVQFALLVAYSFSDAVTNNPPVEEMLLLPRLCVVTNINEKAQATKMANDYFLTYVSGCGIAQSAKDHETYWASELWGSFTGYHFYGIIWIRKSDGEVYLQPPPSGKIPHWTMRKIKEKQDANQGLLPAMKTTVKSGSGQGEVVEH